MGQQEYYSMDQVLKELQIDQEQLQQLISDGEITPQRDGNRFKFLKSEIMQYKFQKMEQPTIMTHENNDLEIIDQLADDGEIVMADAAPGNDDVQPLLSMGNDEKLEEQFEAMMDNIASDQGEVIQEEIAGEILDDEKDIVSEMEDEHLHASDNPMEFAQENPEPVEISEDSIEEVNDRNVPNDQMLEISDQELDESYLAELQNEIKENDTGELKFENSDGDAFMETGEVLSESLKDRKLPADKEVEELFTNEHLEDENENFKSQTHIEGEVDLNEDSPGYDEQAFGVARSELEMTTSETAGSKTKVLVGVILLALLGGIGSSFVFWDPLKLLGLSGKPVEAVMVSVAPVTQQTEITGQVAWLEYPIKAQEAGKVKLLVEVGKVLSSNEPIITLVKESTEKQSLLSQKESLLATIQDAQKKSNAYNTFIKSKANVALMTAVNNLKSKDSKVKATATASLQKEPLKKLYAQYTKLLADYQQSDKAKKLAETQIAAIEAKLSSLAPSELIITAPEAGKIVDWKVQDGDMVNVDFVLGNFQSNSQMVLAFSIPQEDATPYTLGNPANLLHAGQDITFIVQKSETVGNMVQVTTTIPNANQILSLDPVSNQYCFAYPKSLQAPIVAKNLVYSEGVQNYVLVIRNDKVAKQIVQIRSIWGNENDVIADGLQNKDLVITTKDAELLEGTRVRLK